ncbi:MAG: LptF/LptG family permease [Chlamydiae bacterium]|nr:LptF/LptG family permease [Chlamydiota bacterium]
MILFKRWERYLFLEVVKIFLFFLFAFFFVFSLMDYATHMKDFSSDGKMQASHLLSYYSCQFVKRSEILLPLAILIACTKVLCSLNATKELVALQASGLKLRLLLRPFFLLAGICCLFNYISAEKILPSALNYLDEFEHRSHYNGRNRNEPFHVLYLQDQSKLIYQKHDKSTNSYMDVYWIRSFNDIWKIKTLKADPKNPVAEFADHLVRNKDGLLMKAESLEKCFMKGLTWQKNLTRKGMIPIENRKISHLYKMLKNSKGLSKKNYSEIQTYFTHKLISPLLCILVVLGIAPFCIKYTRTPPVFYIYCIGLFSYIAFYTFMDSCIIIATHNTIHPLVALLAPFSLCSSFFCYKFLKSC